MKMLREIINCKSFQIFLKNFYAEVSFSKVRSLQCADSNFAIKRTHHTFFWNMYRKLKRIKRESIFLRKESLVDQPLNKFTVHNPKFYERRAAHVRPSCRRTESSNTFTGKLP